MASSSVYPSPEDYPEFDPIVLKCIGYLHVGGKESRRGLKELYQELVNDSSANQKSRGSSPSMKGNEKRKGGLLEKDPSKKARIDPVKEDILPRFHQNQENPSGSLGTQSHHEPCSICGSDQSYPKDQLIECNECHKAFHQRCHNPKIPDSVIQERVNDPRFIWKCESCNQEFAKAMKESKKKSENQNKEEKISSQPFKRADKVANIKSVSRSREGSPSLAGWGGLVSKSEKPKKEKNKLQQIDIFGGTDELNIKRKKEVNPNAVKALKEKEKKKNKDEVKKDKSRSREKEESDAQKKLASMKKKGADKMKLKQAAKRV